MSPGLVAAQAVHAAFEFADDYPALVHEWVTTSNFLVVVSASDEAEVRSIAEKAHRLDIPKSMVIEPDLDNEVTAVALAPCVESKRLCANLPLALKEKVMM